MLTVAAVLLAITPAGCHKLRPPADVVDAPVEDNLDPPEAAEPLAPPSPAEIVAAFLALPQSQKNDEGLLQVAEQTQEIAAITALPLGGSVITDVGAATLPQFTNAELLELSGSRVSRDALEYVAKMPALKVLRLGGIPLTDGDVSVLTARPALTELVVGRTAIGDGAFEALAELPSLQVLDLSGNDQVLGRTFSELVKQGKFAELVSLSANSSGFGYYGVQQLGTLKHLERLELGRSATNDESIQGLRDCSQLQVLFLYENRISDAGLAALSRLSNLRTLRLDGNPAITDRGLAELRGLRNLEELRLDGTRCTLAGVQGLKQQLHTTKIFFGGQEL